MGEKWRHKVYIYHIMLNTLFNDVIQLLCHLNKQFSL